MHPFSDTENDQVRAHIREHLKKLFDIEDTSGIEFFVTLQRTAHLVRRLDDQSDEDLDISGPRWRLLMRLLIDEEAGSGAGLTPTVISQSQRVSKNTISALLRGLETQGLIQRTLDSTDLRAFRIQLTPAGRDYVQKAAPERIHALNRLLSGLDSAEQEQLTRLLEKLQGLLAEQFKARCKDGKLHSGFAAHGPFSEEQITR
ncbi:MAG: MarR family winged helix-turn-helix transcriptional regulator [Bellilinea sp.]